MRLVALPERVQGIRTSHGVSREDGFAIGSTPTSHSTHVMSPNFNLRKALRIAGKRVGGGKMRIVQCIYSQKILDTTSAKSGESFKFPSFFSSGIHSVAPPTSHSGPCWACRNRNWAAILSSAPMHGILPFHSCASTPTIWEWM